MIDDELLRAVGEMAINAAALEYSVALLVSVARDQDDEAFRKVLGKPGEPLCQLLRLVDDVAQDSRHRRLHRQLRGLARDVGSVLADRGRLLHSVALEAEEAGGSMTFWHARTDQESVITVEAVLEHTGDIAVLTRRAERMISAVDAWRADRPVS